MEAEWSKVGKYKGKVSVAPHPANPKAAEGKVGLIIFFPRIITSPISPTGGYWIVGKKLV